MEGHSTGPVDSQEGHLPLQQCSSNVGVAA